MLLGFSFVGLRASLLDLTCPLAMLLSPALPLVSHSYSIRRLIQARRSTRRTIPIAVQLLEPKPRRFADLCRRTGRQSLRGELTGLGSKMLLGMSASSRGRGERLLEEFRFDDRIVVAVVARRTDGQPDAAFDILDDEEGLEWDFRHLAISMWMRDCFSIAAFHFLNQIRPEI